MVSIISCGGNEPQLLPDEEYKQFGENIVSYIKLGKSKQVVSLYNQRVAISKLKHGIDSLKLNDLVSRSKWKLYKIELEKGTENFMAKISSFAENEGTIELSKFYIKEGKPHIVISIVSKSGVIEIVDFELMTMDSRTYIVDYESFNLGIRYSETFVWEELNNLQDGSYTGDYTEALNELKNVQAYLRSSKFDKAWVAINRVPDYYSYHSTFQVLKSRVASHISDSLYVSTLYDWIGYNYEQEGFRHLKAYEYYSYIGHTKKAHLHLDTLEKIAGSSVLIDTLRNR